MSEARQLIKDLLNADEKLGAAKVSLQEAREDHSDAVREVAGLAADYAEQIGERKTVNFGGQMLRITRKGSVIGIAFEKIGQ